MNIEDTLKEVQEAGHTDVVIFGIGNEGNENSMAFYTSKIDFDWVVMQIARGQFNLLVTRMQENQPNTEVEPEQEVEVSK